MNSKKVVLAHDWLRGYRGGERVFNVFCEMFPEAPIYTLIHRYGTTSDSIDRHAIHTSWINKIPGSDIFYPKLLPAFPFLIESMKIQDEADLFLSSSSCLIKGLRKPSGSRHICYIHSPMRYIYDQFDTYFGDKGFLVKSLAHASRGFLQNYDRLTNKNVDVFIANSKFVQKRITEFYDRDSILIYPFVDLKDFRPYQKISQESTMNNKKEFYLMVTAFAPNKRVDLAIAAFNQLKLPLKIIGSGQEEKKLRSLAGPTIEFLGNLDRIAVIDHLCRAQGFIFPGVEDFGITPLESLASGTPVIAFKAGGVLETLNEDVAFFFNQATVESLKQAVKDFQSKHFNVKNLYARAEEFSKEKFIANIQKVLFF